MYQGDGHGGTIPILISSELSFELPSIKDYKSYDGLSFCSNSPLPTTDVTRTNEELQQSIIGGRRTISIPLKHDRHDHDGRISGEKNHKSWYASSLLT